MSALLTSSALLDLRGRIVDALAAAFDGVDVEAHLGRFDEEQLKHFLAKAPAIRVALMALERPTRVAAGGIEALARFGVYVVTRDGAGRMDRDVAAIAAVEHVLRLADRARWGSEITLPAEPASARNLYTQGLGQAGRALWAIDLPQPVRISPSDAFGTSGPATLFLGVAPEIGRAHEDKYVGPIEGRAPELEPAP